MLRYSYTPLLSFCLLFFWQLNFGLLAQGAEEGKGAIILVSINGDVNVKNIKSDTFLPQTEVTAGKTIYDGHQVITGDHSKAVLLFSNGTVTTLDANGVLIIEQFTQGAFRESGRKVEDLKEEPSQSTTQLELAYGEMVFNVKKLKNGSSFEIESPIGIAGIRGTDGKLTILQDPNSGIITGGLSMLDGNVEFTDPSGNSMFVGPGQGTLVQVTATGQQIGSTFQAPVSPEEAQEIQTTTQNAASLTGNISVSEMSNAVDEAQQNAEQNNDGTDSGATNEGASIDPASGGESADDNNINKELGEAAHAGASGTAEGAIFVPAVAGFGIETLLQVAGSLFTGAAESASETVDSQIAALDTLTFSVEEAIKGNAKVSNLVSVLSQNGDLLGITDDIGAMYAQFESGEITESQLSLSLQAALPVNSPLGEEIKGIINHLSQRNPNRGAITSFLAQLRVSTNKLKPNKEYIIAQSLKGTLEGVVEGAQRANLPAHLIEQLKGQIDGSLSDDILAEIPNISIPNLLANVPIPIPEPPQPPEVELTMDDIEIIIPPHQDPVLADADNDRLFDTQEKAIGTNMNDPDHEGDLLMDGAEYLLWGTDPHNPDTDGDNVTDAIEIGLGEDPTIPTAYGPDTDGDGLPDEYEARLGTDPLKVDTDGDGWFDGFEIGVGLGSDHMTLQANNPLVKNTVIDATGFTVSPLSTDLQTWLLVHPHLRKAANNSE